MGEVKSHRLGLSSGKVASLAGRGPSVAASTRELARLARVFAAIFPFLIVIITDLKATIRIQQKASQAAHLSVRRQAPSLAMPMPRLPTMTSPQTSTPTMDRL